MISGMYLGEIARLMILDLIDRELIFVEEMKKMPIDMRYLQKDLFTQNI